MPIQIFFGPYLVLRGFCYIWPLYNEVPLYFESLTVLFLSTFNNIWWSAAIFLVVSQCQCKAPWQLFDAGFPWPRCKSSLCGWPSSPHNFKGNKSMETLTRTVEPRYNEVLGTMKITLLYQVSHYIRVKKQRNIKNWDQQNYLVIRGFCYIRPLYNEVPLYNFLGILGNCQGHAFQFWYKVAEQWNR